MNTFHRTLHRGQRHHQNLFLSGTSFRRQARSLLAFCNRYRHSHGEGSRIPFTNISFTGNRSFHASVNLYSKNDKYQKSGPSDSDYRDNDEDKGNPPLHMPSHEDGFIERFNYTVHYYGRFTFGFYFFARMGGFAGLTFLCSMIGIESPSLCMAIAINSVIKRFRLPVDVAVAASLAKVAPELTQIKVTPLVIAPPTSATSGLSFNDSLLPPAQRPAAGALSEEEKQMSQEEKKAHDMMQWIVGPVDKYGAAFFAARAGMGILTTTTLASALSLGIDVTSMVNSWGISDSIKVGASSVAFATILNTFLLPVILRFIPDVVPPLAYSLSWRMKLLKLRQGFGDNRRKKE